MAKSDIMPGCANSESVGLKFRILVKTKFSKLFRKDIYQCDKYKFNDQTFVYITLRCLFSRG